MEENKNIPFIGRKETGTAFEMIIPECCRLFAEADPMDKDYKRLEENCPHITKPVKPIKTNKGL